MQQKAVVFGGGGQLGVELCRGFRTGRLNWIVQRFDRHSLDVTDAARVEEAIAKADAQIVLNAAAYNQVDIAEKEPIAAYQANALAVRNLALACRRTWRGARRLLDRLRLRWNQGIAVCRNSTTSPVRSLCRVEVHGEIYAQAYTIR